MDELLKYSLIKIGDFNLTIANIIHAALIIVGALFILFLISRFLSSYFKKKDLDSKRRFALMQLIKYVVWTITIVLVLDSVGFKITILLAGSAALMVGLGFGLQQIFQDLVSGIFILLEGTIRIDDVIELDGLVGKILSVNLRTSRLLTREGIIIIVPNHKFIVDSIINWTHSAVATRFKVAVGVAYGSDVELVRDILVECARAQQDCITTDDMKTYHPFARFVNFGESSLDFELYFWSTNIFHAENTKSDIRFMIDKRFRENGVTIPFPQRDVHIKGQ